MTVCSMTRSKVKVTSPWKLEIRPFSKAIFPAIYNGGWQMTTDSYSRAEYLKLIGAGFFIFVLVFCVTWLRSWQGRGRCLRFVVSFVGWTVDMPLTYYSCYDDRLKTRHVGVDCWYKIGGNDPESQWTQLPSSVANLRSWSCHNCIVYVVEREAALPLRDRATPCVCWNLVNCCTAVRWSTLEGRSRSSELPLFDVPYITSY